jgi:hypothetical protein
MLAITEYLRSDDEEHHEVMALYRQNRIALALFIPSRLAAVSSHAKFNEEVAAAEQGDYACCID